MDNTNYLKLKNKISGFSKIDFFQYNDMNGNEPTGIFCSCLTEIKKDDIIERIRLIISKHDLPFSISDDGLSRTKHFIISFTNKTQNHV